MQGKKKKRKPPARSHHIWNVQVRHRDYIATENDRNRGNQLFMKHTTLTIESPQPEFQRPSIDLAIARVRRFLDRHQRLYGMPGILSVDYQGFIDN